VLGAPPAFILSQDRTLRSDMSMPGGMSDHVSDGAFVPLLQFSPIWIHLDVLKELNRRMLSCR
ncbi:MAG: hypothetical protein ACI361_09860, partial [Atopobiaceae bacterium]